MHQPAPANIGCGVVRSPYNNERSSSWAKLAAINDTMHELGSAWDTILWLDSDAHVCDASMPVPIITAPAGFAAWEDERRGELCAGTMMWRNTVGAQTLLNSWWSANLPQFDMGRQWEQEALRSIVFPRFKSSVGVMPSKPPVKRNHTYDFMWWRNGMYVNNWHMFTPQSWWWGYRDYLCHQHCVHPALLTAVVVQQSDLAVQAQRGDLRRGPVRPASVASVNRGAHLVAGGRGW